ncbi:hypothetical protein [Streptomyces decoyicus]|uniref:hypothetical protein n=1 Tax=Streptomyces decoyicus TaxID=249567 RepID=UPI0038240691
MRKRLFRAGAVVGATLSALVIGGVTETAVAAPATHQVTRVQHNESVPEKCRLVPVKTVIKFHGKKIVITTWKFVCTPFTPPKPPKEPPPLKHPPKCPSGHWGDGRFYCDVILGGGR